MLTVMKRNTSSGHCGTVWATLPASCSQRGTVAATCVNRHSQQIERSSPTHLSNSLHDANDYGPRIYISLSLVYTHTYT
jgi:hypothetical protein